MFPKDSNSSFLTANEQWVLAIQAKKVAIGINMYLEMLQLADQMVEEFLQMTAGS